MNDYNLLERTEEFIENLSKKGFYIELEEGYALPSKDGYIEPSVEVMQAAIEKYCEINHHSLTYIRLQDPIIFMLDENDAYEATPRLINRGLMREYVVHCTEFK